MKWPSLDESFSVCSWLLTVACNSEMQRVFFFSWLFGVCGGGVFWVRAIHLTVLLVSGSVRRSRVWAGIWL